MGHRCSVNGAGFPRISFSVNASVIARSRRGKPLVVRSGVVGAVVYAFGVAGAEKAVGPFVSEVMGVSVASDTLRSVRVR